MCLGSPTEMELSNTTYFKCVCVKCKCARTKITFFPPNPLPLPKSYTQNHLLKQHSETIITRAAVPITVWMLRQGSGLWQRVHTAPCRLHCNDMILKANFVIQRRFEQTPPVTFCPCSGCAGLQSPLYTGSTPRFPPLNTEDRSYPDEVKKQLTHLRR